MRYSFTISHVASKSFTIVDALSRAPLLKLSYDDGLCKKVQAHADLLYRNLPASALYIKEIKQLQE